MDLFIERSERGSTRKPLTAQRLRRMRARIFAARMTSG
jgi:hypothetical protein